MRVNLGCGDRYVEGWVNVDFGTPHRHDLSVDLTGELPWRGTLTHVYAGHLLEHLTELQSLELLKRLRVCAHPGGCVVVLVGPDVEVAERMIDDGTFDHGWGTLESIKHGAGRWAGDVHLWETTGPKVRALAVEAGWPVVHDLTIAQLEGGWPVADRGPQWQYAVRAWQGPMILKNEAGTIAVNDYGGTS